MKLSGIASSVLLLTSLPAVAGETGPLVGITKAHNQVRQNLNGGVPPLEGVPFLPGQPPGNGEVQPVPVPPLVDFVWDDGIAATAQKWAEQCSFGHASGIPYGENIAWGNISGAQATRLWAAEVKTPGYDYDQHQCLPPANGLLVCGHYTQVVWAASVRLGCGYADCPSNPFYVCRYDPPGNFDLRNTRPYCTATQTTGCQLGPEPPEPPEPTLSSVAGLIVPGFEAEVGDPDGPTTLWAVRNTSDATIGVEVRHHGRQLAEQPRRTDVLTLGPQQAESVDVRANLDDLEVSDGFATGLVVITEAAGSQATAENLEGDYFRIDSGNDLATGGRLVRPSDLCTRQEIRIADFGSGTELRILLDDPQGDGTPSFAYVVYGTNGAKLAEDEVVTSDHLNVIDAAELVDGEPFGSVVFDFGSSGGGFVTGRYSAFGRFSVEIAGACLDD